MVYEVSSPNSTDAFMWLKRFVHRYINQNPRLRRTLTRLIEGRGETTVSLFGVTLTIDKVRENGYLRASRISSLSSLFGDEAPVLVSLASLVPHVDTLIDAGANVGLFSAVLGRLNHIYPRFKCVAFEADPTTFSRLSKNLSGPHQTCHNVALSDTESTLRFVRGAVSHVTTTVENANAYSLNEFFEVSCRRLDSFPIPGERILLKIDVEGQELRVLRGAGGLFEERRCTAVYLDGYECQDEVRQFLHKHDFVYFDGRSLEDARRDTFSLLAVRKDLLEAVSQTR